MPIPKQILVNFYIDRHLSMEEIARVLGCSQHKVKYWKDYYGIKSRSHSDANYYKYNPAGDPYSITPIDTLEKVSTYSLALGLFWGEGNKRDRHSVRLGNSDPIMLKHWQHFLIKICNIKSEKIKYDLQTFNDTDLVFAISYWAHYLNIHPDRVRTSQPVPSQGNGSYTKLNTHGVLTISVHNIHFRQWLIDQLKKLGYNSNL